jgi:hypothetical protein
MCPGRMNNLISFIRIIRTYTKAEGLTTQATTTTPRHCQEGCEQPKKEHTTPAILRPRALESIGHLPHPLLGPHCVQTRAPPLGLQLWEMGHGGNQCRTGPPADPVSGHSIDLALKQLRRRGHKCCQRRRPINAT